MAATQNGKGSSGGRKNGVTSGDGKVHGPSGRKLDTATGAGGYKVGPTHKGNKNGPMGHSVQNSRRMPV